MYFFSSQNTTGTASLSSIPSFGTATGNPGWLSTTAPNFTTITPQDLNGIAGELINVVVQSGQTPQYGNTNQLYLAIQKIANAQTTNIVAGNYYLESGGLLNGPLVTNSSVTAGSIVSNSSVTVTANPSNLNGYALVNFNLANSTSTGLAIAMNPTNTNLGFFNLVTGVSVTMSYAGDLFVNNGNQYTLGNVVSTGGNLVSTNGGVFAKSAFIQAASNPAISFGNGLTNVANSYTRYLTASDSHQVVLNSTNATWSLYNNGSTVISGSYLTTSDESIKSNITTVANALDTVTSLRGVTYDHNLKNGEPNSGLIAQELEVVLPHLVANTGELLAVDYSGLSAYFVEAFKELSQKIISLETRLANGTGTSS